MRIKQVKEEALQIIDAYSENGYITSDRQPEKADFILRIHGFINQAILRLITVYPIVKRLEFEDLEREDCFDGIHYRLPDDYVELVYLKKGMSDCWGSGQYTVIGGEMIAPYLVPPVCYYSALPERIPSNASEEYEIPIAEAGARLIPLYVAGMLVAEENSGLSVRLLNQFEAMLAQRIGEKTIAAQSLSRTPSVTS